MSEISINSIYDGVSLALHAAFPDRQVHGRNVTQGLKPGDLNVVLPGGGHSKQVGPRWRRTPLVDVIYYPTDLKKAPEECNRMAQDLSLVLGDITTPEGDTIHATGIDWQVADGVLHVTATYDHFVRIVPELDMMETLRIEQEG